MEFVVIGLLALIAFGVLGVGGSLRILADHHKLFTPPEPEAGERVEEGDTVVVRAFDYEQVCSVTHVARHSDGYLVLAVEPVGSARS